MPQTSYSLDPATVVPGQVIDAGDDTHIEPFIAAEVIAPGLGVELTSDGKGVQLPQGTGTGISAFAGFAVFKDAREPGSYAIGDIVPVLRKGRIAANCVGSTTITALGAANVSHSSTLATDRGKITSAATSGTAGSEVASVGAIFRKDPGVTNVAIIEVNLP